MQFLYQNYLSVILLRQEHWCDLGLVCNHSYRCFDFLFNFDKETACLVFENAKLFAFSICQRKCILVLEN